METLRIWNALGKTDPKHTKKFERSGGFRGTAVKPMYCIRRVTQEFGPCGEGWGINEPSFQVVPGHNGEIMVFCTVSIWWKSTDQKVFGVGGDKIVNHWRAKGNRPERWENDDEAFKKAFTDALTNAMKHLGVAADIHMGLFDDSKYVNDLLRELDAAEGQSDSGQPKSDSRPLPRQQPPPQQDSKPPPARPQGKDVEDATARWIDQQKKAIDAAEQEGTVALHEWSKRQAEAMDRLRRKMPHLAEHLMDHFHSAWNRTQQSPNEQAASDDGPPWPEEHSGTPFDLPPTDAERAA